MEKILFLAHTEGSGTLSPASAQALAAAVALSKSLPGSTLTVGVWGEGGQAAADAIAGCGAVAFFSVTGKDFDVPRYASDAAAAEALVRKSGASVVIAPASSRISRALPGVAVRVGGRIETHVVALTATGAKVQIKRWYYRQRLQATMSRAHRPWCLVVDAGVFDAWQGAAGKASVEAISVALPEGSKRTRVEGVVAASASVQTIRPDADLLFVAGAGWTKKQADGQSHAKQGEGLILEFLEKSKASLGGSKSLVDLSGEGREVLSFMSHMNQVGQTGSSPRHRKGLSTCCHGEEPHVVGWRFITERRAINKDANCGWARGKADVVYVADAFEVMAKVNALLAKG
ncbi:MAG: electron transfer flavoprotein alpha subunit-like protein [Myxococcaceae bacterium]|nr:electron transfer flavoprotein alpha subunit-like protein [Myxococcaceae bacterium]